MENTQEVCGICKKDGCDFETRCSHLFHEECLKASVFALWPYRYCCPNCQTEFSSDKLVEKLIRSKEDFSEFPIASLGFWQLEDLIIYGLKTESPFPLELIFQNWLEQSIDIDLRRYWLKVDAFQLEKPQSLFYASYVCGKVDFTHKLMEMGCEIDQGMHDQKNENESVIPHAARINDYEFIKKLIGLGININGLDFNTSALHVACETDNVEMIEFLLENGAEFYDQEHYQRIDLFREYNTIDRTRIDVYETPLTLACLKGSLNAVRYLHNHQPELFTKGSAYWDAFAAAIKSRNMVLMDLLIEFGGDISIESESKINLLMVACAFGNIEIINYIFDKGNFDINSPDSSKKCALYYFLLVKKSMIEIAEMVRFLVEKGADPFAILCKDANYTVLHWASGKRNYKLIEYLLTETPLSHCSLKDIRPSEKGLIEMISMGSTMFHETGKYDEEVFKTIDLFLQKGLDINEKNLKGETALSFVHDLFYNRVKFLLSRGADVNSVDSKGVNCLQKMFCHNINDESCIKILIDHGIDLNSRNNDGWTLMHYVFRTRLDPSQRPIIGYLLESGARADLSAPDGQTPFDVAWHSDPFSVQVSEAEKRGVNFSKRISEDVRSKPCDQCHGNFASLKARCGHYLHLTCFKNKSYCPICDIRITVSNSVEKLINEGNFNDFSVVDDQELLILMDNWVENDNIVDFASLTNELRSRKESRGEGFILNIEEKYLNDLFSLTNELSKPMESREDGFLLNIKEKYRYPKDLLLKACAYGRFEFVKFCDSIKLDTKCSPYKSREVVFAAISGNTDIIEYCLGKIGSSYINEKCWIFYPIQIAILTRNLETFDYCIKKGANLKIECYGGLNLLQFACSVGAFEIVKKLIEDHGFDPNATNKNKQNSLFFTVSDLQVETSDRDDIMSYLNKVPAKNDDECIEMAKYLLDCGAILNSDDVGNFDSPVSITGLYDREKVFDFFIDYSRNVLKKPLKIEDHKTLLVSIAKCGKNLKFFEKVIGMSADVNWADNQGFTALMGACQSRNFEMCRKLIELGANVNAAHTDKSTALHYLLSKNSDDNVDILDLLLENGADINMTAPYNYTALHFAAGAGALKSVKKLLSAGINPNCVDSRLVTPLHLLLVCLNKDENDILLVVKELVEAGADIHAKCRKSDFNMDLNSKTPFSIVSGSIRLRKVAEYFDSLN